MKHTIPSLFFAGLLAAGCATQGRLVDVDAEQILAVAAREIKAKCPEFKMEEYEPAWVFYHAGVDSGRDGTISVTYLSRKPTDVHDWKSLTNGPPRTASTHRSAQVNLSNDGRLQKQNVSEWTEFPEWVFVRLSEVTRVTPKDKEMSNEASHGTALPRRP